MIGAAPISSIETKWAVASHLKLWTFKEVP